MYCFKPTAASLRLSSSLPARLSARSYSIASAFLRPTALPRPAARKPFAVPSRRAFSHTSSVQFSPSATMAGESVVSIKTPAEFADKVRNSTDLVVLDCFAEWCGPCKAIAPKVEQFSKDYPQAKFYKIDVDELSDVAAELGIRAMPTFMLFKNGEKVADVVGANPGALEAGIKNLIA